MRHRNPTFFHNGHSYTTLAPGRLASITPRSHTMGHQLIQTAPNTKQWHRVIEATASFASTKQLAALVAVVAARGFTLSQKDRGLIRILFLFTRTVFASRADNFVAALALIPIPVPPRPTIIDLANGFSASLQRWFLSHHFPRTDCAEMGEKAAIRSLIQAVQKSTAQQFPTASELPLILRPLSEPEEYSQLAQDFYAQYTERFLRYHLERELPLHAGEFQRFPSPDDRLEFDEELRTHCQTATQEVRTYFLRWLQKHPAPESFTERAAQQVHRRCMERIQSVLLEEGHG